MKRRNFILQTGTILAGSTILPTSSAEAFLQTTSKKRIAMVGLGIRAFSMWGKSVVEKFGNEVEFVGLCDINEGRLRFSKSHMGVSCPTFTDFDQMMRETKPDILMVTTVDNTHHEFIIKGMEMGANIITEKPLTTDEDKCQAILRANKIGKITSVDFHWYLDTSHGADYFRRWHRLRAKGGSLLVHKASHHFDLLNWWIDSDPEEVFAYGSLDFYGKNNTFSHTHCRTCPHTKQCDFYWDITKNPTLMKLYVENEKYDGYLRDGCVWKEDIDIFDKMAVQIKYANKVQVSYSLTAYAPYEGYRISFNGTKGKMDAWIKEKQPWDEEGFDEIQITSNFGKRELIKISNTEGGHGGGDDRMKQQIFLPNQSDPYRQAAGLRDGAFAILTGIAARNSIDTGKPVKIGDLTSLVPGAKKL
jgi:predicted dehydrogenase